MNFHCETRGTADNWYSNQYSSCVKIGNWFEKQALEEELMKDYLFKKENGQLICQKTKKAKQTFFKDVELDFTSDGFLRIGNSVSIVHPATSISGRKDHFLSYTLPFNCIESLEDPKTILCTNSMELSATDSLLRPTNITTFVIRDDNSKDGSILGYEQPFHLCTYDEKRLMHCEFYKFYYHKTQNKSRQNNVSLVEHCNCNTLWRILPLHKTYSIELKGSPVAANSKIFLNHIMTNENLCLEDEFFVRTPNGNNMEVSCKTKLNSRRIETDSNHWLIANQGYFHAI